MQHVDEITAMALAEGAAAGPAAEHAASCPRCRELVADYNRLFATITEVSDCGRPPNGLLRWARAYAHARPVPAPRWVALTLLGGSTSLVPAVRGGLAEIALLYGDDAHHLDLRVEPRHGDRANLHGHVIRLAGTPACGYGVSVMTTTGDSHRTETDATGEFWIDGVADWERASLVAAGDEERLVVARIGGAREAHSSS